MDKIAEKTRAKVLDLSNVNRTRPAGYSKSYVYKPLAISKSTNKKLRMPRRGYDILGNIAIIDIADGKKKEMEFAKSVLAKHKSVKTILAKAGAVSGTYRTRKYRYVLGERTFITTYRENNCVFRFDVRKTFFSNRLSYERARIAGLVKENENVMVFFSGIGPFVIEIAKVHKKANVVGIELNGYACKAAAYCAKMNKVANVKFETGDVKKLAEKYEGFADRIIMPLPQDAAKFLDQALLVAKKKATVHLYAFGPSTSAFNDIAAKVDEHAARRKYNVAFKSRRVVRPYSAKDVEIVLDYLITK